MAQRQSIVANEIALNPRVILERFDPYSNDDDINENGIDSTVNDAVDDNQADEDDDAMTATQQTVESKPNLAYGFRDRNSSIFQRRHNAINALLADVPGDRQRKNPTKKRSLEKKFKCDKCTYSAASKSRLKEHGVVHSKDKPFQCEVCKERMSYRHSLKLHSLRRHGIILLN